MATYKIFPFAPGISWELKHGKYILPKISLQNWKKAIEFGEAIVTLPSHAGLLEAFYSISILETLNKIEPQLNLFWSGPAKYRSLIDINKLASIYETLPDELLKQFPAPIFLDKDNRCYFNCLNNYLEVNTYYGEFGYKDNRAIIRQISEKSLVPWDSRFLPKFRKISYSNELITWQKLNKVFPNSVFILIMPDSTGISNHKVDCLGWSLQTIKSLAAMLSQIGIITIVVTKTPTKFFDSIALTMPFSLDIIIQLIPQAYAILSKEIDFLLLALSLTKHKILLKNIPSNKNYLDLKKNVNFIGTDHSPQIYVSKNLNVMNVFETLKK